MILASNDCDKITSILMVTLPFIIIIISFLRIVTTMNVDATKITPSRVLHALLQPLSNPPSCLESVRGLEAEIPSTGIVAAVRGAWRSSSVLLPQRHMELRRMLYVFVSKEGQARNSDLRISTGRQNRSHHLVRNQIHKALLPRSEGISISTHNTHNT